jgi:hypothetical protein
MTLAKERMVGWYHTGPQLRVSDQEINDVFKRYMARPVMVIVDTRQSTVGIPTEAYFAVEEIKDVSTGLCLPHRLLISRNSGWYGDQEDVLPCPFGNRGRRSRRDRRRAPVAGHQGFDHNNPNNSCNTTGGRPSSASVSSKGPPRLSTQSRCGQATSQPPNHISSPRRAQPPT